MSTTYPSHRNREGGKGLEDDAELQSCFQSFKERVIGRRFDERVKGTCVASSFSAGEIGLESASNVFWGGGFGHNSSVVSENSDFNQWRGGEVMREDVIEYRTEVGPLRRAR
ncbi:hypothetical protein TNIN_280411 [Trichonephila inaurata madagascariensis]|uniref:Uncharacterized protein n=1 Tax=Trichonephila inaurata madagascariensis TaxID=2747483 RepID=A0A8X6KLI3_9ARAC|nr:hypothetical protein TNIN_280411 [Trichonephila inaurata madagascariensis]